MIHPALYRELDYDKYRVEAYRYHAAQIAPLRAPSGEDAAVLYYWVFPGLMLNFYPGSLQANAVIPLITSARSPSSSGMARARTPNPIAFSHRCSSRTSRSRTPCRRTSLAATIAAAIVRRENGVHFFHGLLHEFLAR
jgi:hypothetical protein